MRPVTRALRGLTVAAVAALALTACAGGQPQPRGYGEPTDDGSGFYGNFMLGCTGVEPNDDSEYVNVELESQEFCHCVYEGLSDPGDGVPFDQVRAFEEAQAEAEDGSDIEVPKNIQRIMDECAESARG